MYHEDLTCTGREIKATRRANDTCLGPPATLFLSPDKSAAPRSDLPRRRGSCLPRAKMCVSREPTLRDILTANERETLRRAASQCRTLRQQAVACVSASKRRWWRLVGQHCAHGPLRPPTAQSTITTGHVVTRCHRRFGSLPAERWAGPMNASALLRRDGQAGAGQTQSLSTAAGIRSRACGREMARYEALGH